MKFDGDELAQVEVRFAARLAVLGQHLFRRLDGQSIDEALAVRVDLLELHALEQLPVNLGGCFDVGGDPDACQDQQQEDGDGLHFT